MRDLDGIHAWTSVIVIVFLKPAINFAAKLRRPRLLVWPKVLIFTQIVASFTRPVVGQHTMLVVIVMVNRFDNLLDFHANGFVLRLKLLSVKVDKVVLTLDLLLSFPEIKHLCRLGIALRNCLSLRAWIGGLPAHKQAATFLAIQIASWFQLPIYEKIVWAYKLEAAVPTRLIQLHFTLVVTHGYPLRCCPQGNSVAM